MPQAQTREPEQLSLFAHNGTTSPEQARVQTVIIPVAAAPAVASTPSPRKRMSDSKQKLNAICSEPGYTVLAEKLSNAAETNRLRPILRMLSIDSVHLGYQVSLFYHGVMPSTVWKCQSEDSLTLVPKSSGIPNTAMFHGTSTRRGCILTHELLLNLAYVSTETAEVVMIPLKITMEENSTFDRVPGNEARVLSLELGKAFLPTKILNNVFFLQDDMEINELVVLKKPWIATWLTDNPNFDVHNYLAAPWLETLHKAGFSQITSPFLDRIGLVDKSQREEFNRLCGPGTRPKDIFKCTKTVYSILREEHNLSVWDTLRRLEKKEHVTSDAILMVYQMGLTPKELDYVNSILSQQHHGRPVFSVTSLINYLNRLDMYEALVPRVSLPILTDYLHMCRQLDIRPRIDGDSLKREHDIAARLVRARRDEQAQRLMQERAEWERREIEEGNSKLARATYYENVFFVRPITDYDDLLDEARQQDNCVASYAERIARGDSRIFTLRETAHPERSLVTIELSPDCRTIRQKSLAHNHQIRNKAINDFIERWHKQLNAA